MNNPSPARALSHSLSSYHITLTPFMHVDRQKVAGPLGGAYLAKPAYWLSSYATLL